MDDHWWKLWGYCLLVIHWFNPLCWIAYILFCRDIEMACDEKVIRNMDIDGKAGYSQALLNLSNPRKMIAACPIAFGELGVKKRVKGIINYKKQAFWLVIMGFVGCIIVGLFFLTDQKKAEDTNDKADEAISGESKSVISAYDENKVAEEVIDSDDKADELLLSDSVQGAEDIGTDDGTDDSLFWNGPIVNSYTLEGTGGYSVHLVYREISKDGLVGLCEWSVMHDGQIIYNTKAGKFDDPLDWLHWDFVEITPVDLDNDGMEELVIIIDPHYNSCSYQRYMALKQEGDCWKEMKNSSQLGVKDEAGVTSNWFPVKAVWTDRNTVEFSIEGCENVVIDMKGHDDKKQYEAGDEADCTTGWGIFDFRLDKVGNKNCIVATQCIVGAGGKNDWIALVDIYFNYDSSGNIKILKMQVDPQ